MKPGCYGTKKNVETFFIATNAQCLENHCEPAWFLQNKYSIIYEKAFTKIILHMQSLWSTSVASNKKGNPYSESMLILRTCHAFHLIFAK